MWQRGSSLVADTSEYDNANVRRDEVAVYGAAAAAAAGRQKKTNTNNLDIEGMLRVASENIGTYAT